MFNFKKKEKYLVVCTCYSLCSGVDVAVFYNKEAAEEYCEQKNNELCDDDYEYGIITLK